MKAMPEAIKFVEHWREQFPVALLLANKCREAADAEGITLDDTELNFGSLEKIIYEAMHHTVGKT